MFFRRKQPELTTDAYVRWLRAQRPPMALFLTLSELEQEALAEMGDGHTQELVEALALALANPQALAAGVDVRDAAAGDSGVEESLAKSLAKGLAAKLSGAQKPASGPIAPPVDMPRETFAGMGERRVTELSDNTKRPALFGQHPVDRAGEEINAP